MKKFIAFFMAMVMLCSVFSVTGFAIDSDSDVVQGKVGNYNWSVDKTTGILKLTGSGKMIDFSTAAPPWYDYKDYITKIELPDGLTNISKMSFEGFDKVKSVVIPDSVSIIDEGAFQCCEALESISIPDSVTDIESSVFYGCSSLKEITLPDGITYLASALFWNCASLENIVIPDSVTGIGNNAFDGCVSLESITIPSKVSGMSISVLDNCPNLKSITFDIDEKNGSALQSFPDLRGTAITEIVVPASAYQFEINGKFPESIEKVTIYNPDFALYEHCGLSYKSTIVGFKGSTAEAFAEEYGATFIDIETIHTHEYKTFEEEGYCSFSRCICGKENSVPHLDADYNAKCDGCGTSMNDIDIGTCEKTIGYRGNYFAFTATKAGDYTFSVSGLQDGHFDIAVLNEDKSDILEYAGGSVCTYNLKAGQKVYWFIERRSFDYIDVEITLSYEVAHKHFYTFNVMSAATCTLYGSGIYTCACGDFYHEAILPTGHAYSYWSVVKMGSCKEGASIKRVCKNCNATETSRVIGIGKHTYKTVVTKAATLSSNGKTAVKCSDCGVVDSTSTVYSPKTISLSATSYVYNGKVKTPSVTVKDSKGKTLKKDTDYTVKYASGRKSTGKYSVTITFKGKYSGKKTLYFTIAPANVTLSKVTAGSKSATVTWKTTTGASGYQVMYSISSGFKSAKTATVSGSSSKKTTIKKLTKGKKYYFKVRAYKTVDGKKVYSSWSSVKSVKIK